ncbi:hypothetical protein [Azospirillum picis]|uniref:Transposase n=1 Tax=Azospirillum picis TaxID=488438 RepID=A0ABU0MJ03_9PROT|nr:hypothetical protein [Azospirillum picis]MBP2299475.1 hypothetical protein [Azospirillum picis]MDQ0533398.1 hypothetical protein [Azospirillum picis]
MALLMVPEFRKRIRTERLSPDFKDRPGDPEDRPGGQGRVTAAPLLLHCNMAQVAIFASAY